MKLSLVLPACLGSVALATITLTAPVHATADTTPPKLTSPARAGFVKGTSISTTDPMLGTEGIRMRATWRGSDASGIAGYRTRVVYAGTEPGPWSALSQATSATRTAGDYEDQFGGGSQKIAGIDVRVRDLAGNRTDRFIGYRPVVYQEDGTSYGYGDLRVSYTGSWGTSNGAYWSGGTTRRSSTKGDTVTFTVDATVPRQPVALVTETAPDRGALQVLVDGVAVATVDTYADRPTHRRVVWAGRLSRTGSHTVQVVNQGTSGRPRIDVDALLVSS